MEQPINILIVDDEPKNLTVLETVLNEPSYRLVRAGSAEQALLALVVEEFALLILDIRMPGMTGIELAQVIKKRKRTAEVPIIFLTAFYNDDVHMLEGYGTGAVDYLNKPVNAVILRAKVAVFTELHRKVREGETASRILLAEVTERRRAEEQLQELNETLEQRVAERTEALRESEERYELAVEGSAAAIWGWDVVTGQMYYSPHWAEMRGYLPAEISDRPEEWSSRIHPEDAPRVRASLSAHVAGKTSSFSEEYRIACKDGSWKWVHDRAIARRDASGRAIRMAGSETDITERKHTEDTLRESEALLRSITDNTEDIIFVKDLHSNTIFKNPAGLRANALPPEQVIGRSDAEFNVDRGQAEQFIANDRRVMESGKTETFEEVLTSAKGEKRVLLTTKTPRFDGEGRIIGLVGVAHDITERKHAEEVLSASLHEKEVLLREIHHRVKNNLQIVSSLLNLQSRKLTDAALIDVLASTRDRVKAMASVHEQLYESGDFAKIDLCEYIRNLVRMLTHAHSPAGVSVRPVFHLGSVTVDLNTAVPLSLIANELITNALKYAYSGRREGTLTIGLHADGDWNELRITDDGPGLPAGVEPSTTKTLGLRLVRDLARQIRGEVKIESTATGASVGIRWLARLVLENEPSQKL